MSGKLRQGQHEPTVPLKDGNVCIDASDEITRDIQNRIRGMLPDPVPSVAEAATGDFPAIREPDEPARFR